ncbi:Domain of unknown function DUF1801 [Thermaerobacter marianensis DSM 12885]|uniref:YdhG-like domain-containing protein n=1 Tax=Thermaerobacter marianensis (strain ATCC 700841 / DSM 12885 / JCM 10246 / 7p75a) TaxID=644966 RepID=E6SHS7_THEM7|nr:DUF1801 domain-containing protein [Thermaerobacter marianensis]ADU50774.1 Domain of unknown function DUF1801 [Thermaerobacter marianensis DSM 12885]
MSESRQNPQVDALLEREIRWRDEFRKLREILLDLPLEETVKWGQPCYTHGGKNVVLIHGFKEYCALLFFKGALLDDPHGVLVRQTETVRAARQMRFTSLEEIEARQPIIRDYVHRAIAIEEAGLKVDFSKGRDLPVPDELEQKFAEMPALRAAFEALTPGRRRAYLLYFSRAKRPATRLARIQRSIPRIMEGKGPNE